MKLPPEQDGAWKRVPLAIDFEYNYGEMHE